jgi:hypothetical protein
MVIHERDEVSDRRRRAASRTVVSRVDTGGGMGRSAAVGCRRCAAAAERGVWQ